MWNIWAALVSVHLECSNWTDAGKSECVLTSLVPLFLKVWGTSCLLPQPRCPSSSSTTFALASKETSVCTTRWWGPRTNRTWCTVSLIRSHLSDLPYL
jgi:hypothetical protein